MKSFLIKEFINIIISLSFKNLYINLLLIINLFIIYIKYIII